MFFFYVLRGKKTGRNYKGHCENLHVRIKQHNAGKTRSSKTGIPWVLIYYEMFDSREEAVAREKYYKTLKGGKELKQDRKSVV